MITREVVHQLTGFGAVPSTAQVTIGSLTLRERVKRAALGPVLGVVVTLIVLPIPIVHLIIPPLALIGGLVYGAMRATQREIIAAAQGRCPFCATDQTLGLTGAPYRMPRDLTCRHCRKSFTIDAR